MQFSSGLKTRSISGVDVVDLVRAISSPDMRAAASPSVNGNPTVGPNALSAAAADIFDSSNNQRAGTNIAVIKLFNDLSFASATAFVEAVEETVSLADPAIIVVDSAAVSDVDGSGFYCLADTVSVLRRRHTLLFFAALPQHARLVIKRAVKYTRSSEWNMRLCNSAELPDGVYRAPLTGSQCSTSAATKNVEDPVGSGDSNGSGATVFFFPTTELALHAARLEVRQNASWRPSTAVLGGQAEGLSRECVRFREFV